MVAEATVLAAADAQDLAADFANEHGHADDDLEQQATLLAAKTKGGIESLALKAARDLFAVGGALGSSLAKPAHAVLAQPDALLARVIGDNFVNGRPLPREGFF